MGRGCRAPTDLRHQARPPWASDQWRRPWRTRVIPIDPGLARLDHLRLEAALAVAGKEPFTRVAARPFWRMVCSAGGSAPASSPGCAVRCAPHPLHRPGIAGQILSSLAALQHLIQQRLGKPHRPCSPQNAQTRSPRHKKSDTLGNPFPLLPSLRPQGSPLHIGDEFPSPDARRAPPQAWQVRRPPKTDADAMLQAGLIAREPLADVRNANVGGCRSALSHALDRRSQHISAEWINA